MAVPVEEAIAALATFSLEDDQPEIQGLGFCVPTERGATDSPIGCYCISQLSSPRAPKLRRNEVDVEYIETMLEAPADGHFEAINEVMTSTPVDGHLEEIAEPTILISEKTPAMVEAEFIWALGKSIGMCGVASDAEMIRQLVLMEERDRDAACDPNMG